MNRPEPALPIAFRKKSKIHSEAKHYYCNLVALAPLQEQLMVAVFKKNFVFLSVGGASLAVLAQEIPLVTATSAEAGAAFNHRAICAA